MNEKLKPFIVFFYSLHEVNRNWSIHLDKWKKKNPTTQQKTSVVSGLGLISSAGLQNLMFYDVYFSYGVVAEDKRANFSPIWTEIVILCAYPIGKAVILRDRKIQFSSIRCSGTIRVWDL